MSRMALYTEDVHYSDYQDFQGIHYPTHIEVAGPRRITGDHHH